MDIKSVSSIILKAKDLDATAAFYEELGFRMGDRAENRLTVYSNWFWILFIQGTASRDGYHELIGLKVDDIDAAFELAVGKGLDPDRQSADLPFGKGEFIVSDPDGHRLLIFNKK